MIVIIKSVYPNLEREMLKNDKTVNDIQAVLGTISLEYTVRKLIDEFPITVLDAKKIKNTIGSDLPIEELFKREGD